MAAMENFGSETELEMDPLKHLLKVWCFFCSYQQFPTAMLSSAVPQMRFSAVSIFRFRYLLVEQQTHAALNFDREKMSSIQVGVVARVVEMMRFCSVYPQVNQFVWH